MIDPDVLLKQTAEQLIRAANTSRAPRDHDSRAALANAITFANRARREQVPSEKQVLVTDAQFWAIQASVSGPGGTKQYRKAMTKAIANVSMATAVIIRDQENA